MISARDCQAEIPSSNPAICPSFGFLFQCASYSLLSEDRTYFDKVPMRVDIDSFYTCNFEKGIFFKEE